MNFKEELEQRTREAEEIIKSYLPKEEGFAKNMAEAMNYSMLSGGKRLRPVFMREVYSMFGGMLFMESQRQFLQEMHF